MKKEEKALVIGKKIECIVGIVFLILPIISVVCFLFNWLDWADGNFVELRNLGGAWDYHFGGRGDNAGASASPAPIYLGLMAIAGAYLIKDSLSYLFIKEDKKENTEEA